jgi:hypothetical protein
MSVPPLPPWNRGVRPLPNLETKFVAANTLIGIERPDAQGNLFSNAKVDKLKSDLTGIRHRMFTARTPSTKQHLRERDKTVRLALAEEIRESFGKANDDEIHRIQIEIEKTRKALEEEQSKPVEWEVTRFTNLFGETEETRFDKAKEKKRHLREQIKALESNLHRATHRDTEIDATAKQLAAWDPYDQNASAEFFDPEWMFGLPGGFDVVIGNPPYSSKQSKETRIYRSFFECVEYKCDPYAFFIEFAWRAVKRQGAVALIVPLSWMTNVYYEKLRRRLIDSKSLLRVILIEGLVFESANVDTSLLFLLKGAVESETFGWAVTDPGISSLNLISRSYASVRRESRYDIVPKVDEAWDSIREKIESNTRRLGSFSKISLGMKLSGNDRFVAPAHDKKHPDPIVFGKDVSLYGEIKPVRFFSFASAEIVGGTKNPDVHKTKNKILVQSIRNLSLKRRIVATLDTKGLCFVGTVSAIIPNELDWDIHYLLGLVNSTLLNAYFRHRFTTISLKAATLSELPIKPPTSNPKYASAISKLVQKRLNSQFGHATDLEREIDQLVYALYGLTTDEIRLVEEGSK